MGWEQRGNATYYYSAERVGGRVVKQYVGTGRVAELAALLATETRVEREQAAGSWGAEGDMAMSRDTNENPEPLPKTLPGVVCAQRVRCGKPGCRCTRGHGHLAYYRFWREGGRLRKRYVRRADLAAIRAACAARQREHWELSEAWQQWRLLAAVVRGVSS